VIGKTKSWTNEERGIYIGSDRQSEPNYQLSSLSLLGLDKLIKQLVRAQQLYIQPKTLPRCCNDNTFSIGMTKPLLIDRFVDCFQIERAHSKWVISWEGNLNIAEVTPSDLATKITLFYRIFLYDPEPCSPFNLLRPIRERIISLVLKSNALTSE